MKDDLGVKAGTIAGRLAQQMIDLGLTWSEAVVILGLAAKAIAQAAAATADEGEPGRFIDKGRSQLLGAFDHEVRLVIKAPDTRRNDEVQSDPQLEITRSSKAIKLH
jgi:hypothetical protein